MAEYREIQGAAVQSLASSTGTIEGQIWYDNVNGAFKLESLSTVGTFASAPSLPVARSGGPMFSVGSTQDAVLSAGSNPAGPPPDYTTRTDVYDGTSWTAGNPITTAARNSVASGGASTAAAKMVGGYSGTAGGDSTVEDYDGTSFSAAPVMTKGTEGAAGFGTQTAMVVSAGGPISGGPQQTDEWNGVSWTTVNPTGRAAQGGASSGTLTAGLWSGGFKNYPTTIVITDSSSYDGTSWTANNAMNTAKGSQSPTTTGTPTASAVFGGNLRPGITNQTELYDGTSWSNTTTLPAARENGGGAGTQAACLISGGGLPSTTSTVLEWIGPGVAVTKTITTS
jgi:hypothetical protein